MVFNSLEFDSPKVLHRSLLQRLEDSLDKRAMIVRVYQERPIFIMRVCQNGLCDSLPNYIRGFDSHYSINLINNYKNELYDWKLKGWLEGRNMKFYKNI